MIEAITQLFGELLIQLVSQLVAELIGHGVAEVFRRSPPARRWLAALGHVVSGVVLGLLSLLVFPQGMITSPLWRIVYLLLMPVSVGLLMAHWEAWQRGQGIGPIRIDTFAYGYLLALTVALVRHAGVV